MADWLGKTLGKVRIDKYIARGGMAEVYLGTHLTLDRLVAVKVLHGYIEENNDLLARFQREAKVVAGLRHSNIVQIYDFDAAEGHPYIVMEYLSGPTLATYLRSMHERNERIPIQQVAHLLKALTSALDYAHTQGVIHRDIKPGNIMLHGSADEIQLDQPLAGDVEAIITDFGLVRIVNAASQTESGMVSGTPSYMAPEQARGEKTDHRTDIYSLGIVLYEMLAGRVPFEADSTLSVIYMHINEPPPPIDGISPTVQKVINKALSKNPNDRYQSSREMAGEFFLAIGMNAEAETLMGTTGTIPRNQTSQATIMSSTSVAAKPKTASKAPLWIGAGVVSLLCLLAIVIGAIRLLLGSTATANPTTADSTTSPIASNPGGIPTADGMVKIPAGDYEVGSANSDDYHSPSQTISINEYWIDKYQVTNDQYQKFMTQTSTPAPEVWPGEANHPVRGVTWDQAVAYCGSVNKRLPTEAEWEAAGRGSGASPQLYPWGNDSEAGGKISDLPEQDTYAVGSFPFNVSPAGVYDMFGNVWEWVGTPYGTVPDGSKILHGGRFGIPIVDLAYHLTVTPNNTPYIKYAGFRCAADKTQ